MNFMEQDMLDFDSLQRSDAIRQGREGPDTAALLQKFRAGAIHKWKWMADQLVTGGKKLTEGHGVGLNKYQMMIKIQHMQNQNKVSMKTIQEEERKQEKQMLEMHKAMDHDSKEVEAMKVKKDKIRVSADDEVKENICWFHQKMIDYYRAQDAKGNLDFLVKKIIMNTGGDNIFTPIKNKFFGTRHQEFEDMQTWYTLRLTWKRGLKNPRMTATSRKAEDEHRERTAVAGQTVQAAATQGATEAAIDLRK